MAKCGLKMIVLAALLAVGCATGSAAPGAPGANGVSSAAGTGTIAAAAPPPADEYTKDLDKICHVHEITGKSADLGLQAVSQWLLDNVHTTQARHRLAELPDANIPVWLQDLRRDAAARGISPCPFADTWESKLKSM